MAHSAELPPLTPLVNYGLDTKLEACRTSMQVYSSLPRCERNGDQSLASRIRQQSEIVLENLRPLRAEVANLDSCARAARIRTWTLGGAM